MFRLPIFRKVIFATVTLISLAVLAISAHLTSMTAKYAFYFTFAAVGIGAAVLSSISLPALLCFNRMVIMELSWSIFLTIMWLATAGDTAAANATSYFGNCSLYSGQSATACYEIQVVEALSFINWGLILSYKITLLVFGIHVSRQGRRAWTAGVNDITWNEKSFVQQSLLGYPAQPGNYVQQPPVNGPSMYSQPAGQAYYTGYSQQYSPPAAQPPQGQVHQGNYQQQYTPPPQPPPGQVHQGNYQQQYTPPPHPPQGEGYSAGYQQHPPPPGPPPSNEGHPGYHQQYPPSPNPSPSVHSSSGQHQPGGYSQHYPQGQAPVGQGYPGRFPSPPQPQQY